MELNVNEIIEKKEFYDEKGILTISKIEKVPFIRHDLEEEKENNKIVYFSGYYYSSKSEEEIEDEFYDGENDDEIVGGITRFEIVDEDGKPPLYLGDVMKFVKNSDVVIHEYNAHYVTQNKTSTKFSTERILPNYEDHLSNRKVIKIFPKDNKIHIFIKAWFNN